MTRLPNVLPAAGAGGQRLDSYVAEHVESLSRSRVHELILSGHVLVGGRLARPSYRVQAGDQITVDLPDPVPSDLIPEAIPLSVVYEDEDLVVIDKPPGLAVHPAPGQAQHTLVHALLARFPDLPGIGGAVRPGIVHRLDLDTSGLLVVAKTDRGHAALSSQFSSHTVRKGYLALVRGRVAPDHGLVDAPVGRHPTRRQQMAIVANGRPATTRFSVIERFSGYSFLLAMPLSGRTHQIRVHFAGLGHPVAGDALYGGATPFLGRQFLHAALLQFERPSDGARIELCSPLPDDLSPALGEIIAASGVAPREVGGRMAQMVHLSVQHFRHEPIANTRSLSAAHLHREPVESTEPAEGGGEGRGERSTP